MPIVFPELQSPLGQRVADKPENQAATIANLRTRIAQVFDRETWCITGILRRFRSNSGETWNRRHLADRIARTPESQSHLPRRAGMPIGQKYL